MRGTNLLPRLQALGCEVIAPARAAYDLLEQDQVRKLFNDTRPQVVFHLAGLVGGILANKRSPASEPAHGHAGINASLGSPATKPDGQMEKTFDVSRMHQRLGDLCRTTLREGLRKTIEWFLANHRNARLTTALWQRSPMASRRLDISSGPR